MEALDLVLPIVYIVVGCALVWFLIELVITVRKTRKTVDDMQKQLTPAIESVQEISAEVEKKLPPILDNVNKISAGVDPLIDRVSLTVDAANLEIMRLDQILEDVSEITDTASKAVDTVDNVTSMPMDVVNNLASKVRGVFTPASASKESVELGRAKQEEAGAESNARAPKKKLHSANSNSEGYVKSEASK
jgi:ABC-type transporter Mla subunit MlaD